MSFENGRVNNAAFLPGMNEIGQTDMNGYESHRAALIERIGDARDPNIDRTTLEKDLRERAVEAAPIFGEAFLALYEYSQEDVVKVRKLTAKLWRKDDDLRYSALNAVTPGSYDQFVRPRPELYRWMIQERTDLRCPHPFQWSTMLGRRYRDRIIWDIGKLMRCLPQK